MRFTVPNEDAGMSYNYLKGVVNIHYWLLSDEFFDMSITTL